MKVGVGHGLATQDRRLSPIERRRLCLSVPTPSTDAFVLFPTATVTRYHKMGGLKQQKCIVSRFWKSEVHIQGVSRATLPLKPTGENPSLSLLASEVCWPSVGSSVCRCITAVSAFAVTWLLLPVSLRFL